MERPPPAVDAAGRPTATLPTLQLVRLSLYWLGLSAVFAGIGGILAGRLQFGGLVQPGDEGKALFVMTAFGAVIAMVVQPTIGTVSDYTITRWGRRKPYIFIGSVLDVVFLYGIATSNTVLTIAVFVALLQFSSNFAQGPFQGYVPDLVPAHQVGLASSFVGLFSVLGNVTGFLIAYIAQYYDDFFLGTMALGVVELVTMLVVVFRVNDGGRVKSRAGRPWRSIAAEAWGTDILRQRSFVWLVGSRFFVLAGGGVLVSLGTFYLAQTFGYDQQTAAVVAIVVLGLAVAGNLVAVVPASRLSDRVGRKRVIYAACLMGGTGLAIMAVAPILPVALVGATLFGIGSGSFLAVDWALMTDIIPKAESGRYMGISNVATASAGVIALAVAGGLVMDRVNELGGYGTGPRAALAVGVVCYAIGALLLRPVDERRREDDPAEAAPATTEVAGSPAA
jgi:MFS family permease